LLAKEEVASSFKPGDHGTTFGGNPLATAASYAAISLMLSEKLPEKSLKLGNYLVRELKKRTMGMKSVIEVRGRGLMVGVELATGGDDVVQAMYRRGVLANCTAGKVVRFVPPLNISQKDIELVLNIFMESLEEVLPDE
jgi:acetylornithine/succinyldiaminopimelate/putrescine aminotransferase